MKIYCLILALLVSFTAFGQHGCNLRFCHPEGSLGYFYHFHDHFQEFFPSKKMKSLNIKSVAIYSEYRSDIPSIHIQQKPIIQFDLDKNGFVEYFNETNEIEFFYNRRNNGEIITKEYLSSVEEGDTNTIYYEYDSSRMIIKDGYTGHLMSSVREYFFDTQNRVSMYIYHESLNNSDTTFYIYDDVNYTFTDIETTKQDTILTKVWFNENWQPIRERYYKNELMIFEGNYTYENDFLVKYEFDLLQLKPLEVDFDLNIFPNFNDLNNYEKKIHQTVFYYNTNDLLEKIIQTTNDDTCEYRVYYYTE